MSSLLNLIHLTANWQDVNYHPEKDDTEKRDKAGRILPLFSDEWIGLKRTIGN
jgi:hypothetical protein